ncbi:MAG: hypothetical protein ACFE8L_10495 [Candidatus Hodarchaeota archaeon]
MNMKSIFCLVCVVAFLMYYQTNPVFTIVIVVAGLGIYIFYKSKISGSGSGISRFLSGSNHQQENRNMDDLITLVMLQQLLSSSRDERHDHIQDSKKTQDERLEKAKNEVLELLDGE